MTRERFQPPPIARVSCDIEGCVNSVQTGKPGIDRVEYEVLRRAAEVGWALYDGKSVCPTHVRQLVLEATSGDAHRRPGHVEIFVSVHGDASAREIAGEVERQLAAASS